MKDLFEQIDTLPEAVRTIVEEYSYKLEESNTYKLCEEFLDKMYALGYTFEYGLDAIPYNLRTRSIDIYEIVDRTRITSPYYFSKDTMKAFGQTISKFSVKRMPDGRVRISQKSKQGFYSIRYFNPVNNKLELE
jgi:hypothetical protein